MSVIIIITFVGIIIWNNGKSAQLNKEKLLQLIPEAKAVVVASATCGCCRLYADYLKQQGFDVDVDLKSQDETTLYKDQVGIPQSVRSCHTTRIGKYLIEGHVPVEAIEKLLKEKPDIKGIGLAGMPSASPGMPGPKLGPFFIETITNNGEDGGLFLKM